MTTTSVRPAVSRLTRAGRAQIPAKTLRTDRWWLAPLLTFVGLTAWVTYATVRVFMQKYYWVDAYHYLTPFYSPCLSNGCLPEASHFGRFLPDSPLIPYANSVAMGINAVRSPCLSNARRRVRPLARAVRMKSWFSTSSIALRW